MQQVDVRRFIPILNKYRHLPFDYYNNDCCTFVAKIYGEYDGKDYLKDIPYYNTKLGMWRTYIKLGYLEGIVARAGFKPYSNKALIQFGDLVKSQNSLGIWVGDCAIFAGNVSKKYCDIEAIYKKD